MSDSSHLQVIVFIVSISMPIVEKCDQKQCSKMRCPDYSHGKELDVEKYVVHEPWIDSLYNYIF